MDNKTPEQRSENMRRIRSKDTSIELKLRKALWARGVRYRTNVKDVYGKPDIAIKKYKLAIFCDSSFFHGRDIETMKLPETNREFWEKKIKRNIERDKEVNDRLEREGWTVLRFWDTVIKKDIDGCVAVVIDVLKRKKIT